MHRANDDGCADIQVVAHSLARSSRITASPGFGLVADASGGEARISSAP